ncbi:MAG: FHA domain-containing protein, partial [Deltaproteobacteria bacterium]|nr:FHA domain-containing protein [Deltaproteobacteria bacterium]
MALSSGSTLFEAVPALSTMAKSGSGILKLVPVNIDLPPVTLQEGINRIGRDPEQAQHVINGTQVSRLHCAVVVDGSDIWVRDLNSHNGTYINRERVSEGPLNPGDELSISRMATFRLVRDEDLAQVEHMEMIGIEDDLSEDEKTRVASSEGSGPAKAGASWQANAQFSTPQEGASSVPPPPPPQSDVTHGNAVLPREVTKPQSAPLPAEDDSELTLEDVEKQRNVLAILYQISLRCLMDSDIKEREQLLSNVLPRLTCLDAGFILYQDGSSWRASICPGKAQPSDPLVKATFRIARESSQAQNLMTPQSLQPLGLSQGGAMIVPLVIDGQVTGVIGAVSYQDPFSAD